MIELRLSKVLFYSQIDEELFFRWLQKLPSIVETYGEVNDIVLVLKDDPESGDIWELISLYRRYHVDLNGLDAVTNDDQKNWLSELVEP